ncbi:hypothetical protein P9112_004456 [Eukaryota sp. TZLM1-RC]
MLIALHNLLAQRFLQKWRNRDSPCESTFCSLEDRLALLLQQLHNWDLDALLLSEFSFNEFGSLFPQDKWEILSNTSSQHDIGQAVLLRKDRWNDIYMENSFRKGVNGFIGVHANYSDCGKRVGICSIHAKYGDSSTTIEDNVASSIDRTIPWIIGGDFNKSNPVMPDLFSLSLPTTHLSNTIHGTAFVTFDHIFLSKQLVPNSHLVHITPPAELLCHGYCLKKHQLLFSSDHAFIVVKLEIK